MSYRHIRTTCLGVVALAVIGLLSSGCIYEVGLPADGDTTFSRFVPIQGMHQQTHYRDQAAQPIFRDDQPEGMRYPPPGTVTMDGFLRPDQPQMAESAEIRNPVPRTPDNLEYGRYLYDAQCAVCHGMEGHGDGTIVEAGHFAPPPTLHSPSNRNRPDGEMYHIITYGQNQMWAYDTHLSEVERWAVINYIRALQRAEFPEPRDLDRIRNDQ